MKSRRALLIGVGLCGLARPLWAQTGTTGLRRVAILAPSTHAKEEITLAPFFYAMRKLGWIEGRTVEYDRAYGDDLRPNLERLARELVPRRPDLIIAPPSPAAVIARQATRQIPIVFATGTDPVGSGLVASLARPGGNVTGVSSVIESLAPKLVEILRETLPRARRLGLLSDPADPRSRTDLAALAAPRSAQGFDLVVAQVAAPADLEAAIARLAEQKVDAILTSTSLIFNLRSKLLELANARRLPVLGHRTELAEAGALISYGAPLAEQMCRAAALVDKVLRGEKPGDIPVEQPSVFELVVNLKAARALGITIPHAVLLRADRVIE